MMTKEEMEALLDKMTPNDFLTLTKAYNKSEKVKVHTSEKMAHYHYTCLTCDNQWEEYLPYRAVGVGQKHKSDQHIQSNTATCTKCKIRLAELSQNELINRMINLMRGASIGRDALVAFKAAHAGGCRQAKEVKKDEKIAL